MPDSGGIGGSLPVDAIPSGRTKARCLLRAEGEPGKELATRNAQGLLRPLDLADYRAWLRYALNFAPERGYWVLDEYDPEHGFMTVAREQALTDAGALEQAQQWAAGLLARGVENPAWVEMDRCLNPPSRPQVTEWLGLRYAGETWYVALFDSTPPCVVPVAVLDPATGADCDCRGTPRRCGFCKGCGFYSDRMMVEADMDFSLADGEQDPTVGVEPLPWLDRAVPVQAAPLVPAGGDAEGWACPRYIEGDIRERYAVAERPVGYAAQVINMRDGRALLTFARRWLPHLLAFDVRLKCWALYEVSSAHGFLRCVQLNVALPDRDDLPGAQRWATGLIEAEPEPADDEDWNTVPDPPDLVTEWRVLLYDSRVFYVALTNKAPPCRLPVADLLAGTGADCPCRGRADD